MGGASFKMARFFTDPSEITDETARITGEDVNHIINVLRLKKGDEITVCDGNCKDYTASIESLSRDSVIARIKSAGPSIAEPSVFTALFQAVPKSDKMELIIQKAVELGVSRIYPLITSRTVVQFKNSNDEAKKTARWRRVSLEAAKQCGRGIIPSVEYPVSINEIQKYTSLYKYLIMPYENEQNNNMAQHIINTLPGSAALVIGPEGGFSREEADFLKSLGFVHVTMGERILRTETAAITAIALLIMLCEGLKH